MVPPTQAHGYNLLSCLVPGSDESYELFLSSLDDDFAPTLTADLKAASLSGVRRGMETLARLATFDGERRVLEAPRRAFVRDRPSLALRGVVVDAQRTFRQSEKDRQKVAH